MRQRIPDVDPIIATIKAALREAATIQFKTKADGFRRFGRMMRDIYYEHDPAKRKTCSNVRSMLRALRALGYTVTITIEKDGVKLPRYGGEETLIRLQPDSATQRGIEL